MKTTRLLPIILIAILPLSAFSQSPPAPEAAELTKLLKDFLAGASTNNITVHEHFWADDLIYTSALGRRKGKADIMRELRAEAAAPTVTPTPNDEGTTVYTAEDIRIQQYGTTAIVAFRLVATTKKADKTEVANYFNTGTFLKRNAKWQAAGWQATRIPAETEPKK
jgi:hypothetical protein